MKLTPEEQSAQISERNKDPRWQWKKFARGGKSSVLKSMGLINQSKLDAHFSLVATSKPIL